MRAFVRSKLGALRQELKKEMHYLLPSSRPRKILFDHLPKCGGSSLAEYLEAHYPRRLIFTIDGRNFAASAGSFKALSRPQRHRYDLVKGHLAHELLDYVHPECLKVTVLREPVDRIVSHYYFAKSDAQHYLNSRILESDLSLEEYATSDLSDELRNWYTTHFSGLTVAEAEQSPEQTVAAAVDVVLQRYDIIGFLDEFDSFTSTLKDQAMFRHEYQNKRINVTPNRPSLENIPRSTLDRIEEVNNLDIAFFRKIRAILS